MRFHLDEHVDLAIAEGLRQRGVEVTTTQSVGLLSASDEEHVAFALKEGRVIFTNDADFLRISASGEPHAGIVYCPPLTSTIGQIVRHLCLMHDCMDAEEMSGRIDYL